MSAAEEVLAQKLGELIFGRAQVVQADAEDLAWDVLAAIKVERFAVVELPEPAAIADDFALVGDEIRHYAPNGFGAYQRFDLAEASDLARSLLALLAAAKEVSGV